MQGQWTRWATPRAALTLLLGLAASPMISVAQSEANNPSSSAASSQTQAPVPDQAQTDDPAEASFSPPAPAPEPNTSSFNAAMTRGYAAFEAGDLERAESAFAAALAQAKAQTDRPAGASVRAAEAALAEVASARRNAIIRAQREKLIQAIAHQDWREAAAAHSALAAVNFGGPDIAAERRSIEALLDIGNQLDSLAGDSSQLVGAAGTRSLAELGDTLVRVASDSGLPVSRLSSRLDELKALQVVLNQPRPVLISSDGVTEVTVNRYGSLGAFVNQSLMLRPGRYTAVGTRTGFRDVRESFIVPATDEAPVRLEVRCKEPVGTAQWQGD